MFLLSNSLIYLKIIYFNFTLYLLPFNASILLLAPLQLFENIVSSVYLSVLPSFLFLLLLLRFFCNFIVDCPIDWHEVDVSEENPGLYVFWSNRLP